MKSFLYIAPLFLYFPRFLSNVETQPLLATLVALLSMLLGRNRRAMLGFMGLAIFLICWIVIIIVFEDAYGNALGVIQVLVGPFILFSALALRARPPSRKLMAAVAIYFLVSAALELLAPSIYRAAASELLSRSHVADGHRGVSLFTPEPTYAAISIIYFMMLALWSGRYWGFSYRWIEPALAMCLILTGSTYVVLLILALAFVRWPRRILLATAFFIFFVPMIGIEALDNDASIRAVVAISRLLSSDFSNFLPVISVADSSLGSRLTINAASFLTPVHSPLGLGLECSALPQAFDATGFNFAYSNPVLRAVMDEACLKPQSYGAAIALALGAQSLVFAILLVGLTMYARGRTGLGVWAPPLSVAVVLFAVQGQLTSPIPWLLIFFGLNCVPMKQDFRPYRA